MIRVLARPPQPAPAPAAPAAAAPSRALPPRVVGVGDEQFSPAPDARVSSGSKLAAAYAARLAALQRLQQAGVYSARTGAAAAAKTTVASVLSRRLPPGLGGAHMTPDEVSVPGG